MKNLATLPLVMVFAAATLGQGCTSPKTQSVPAETTSSGAATPAMSSDEKIVLQNTSFVGDSEKRLPGWFKTEHGSGQSYTFESDDKIFYSAPSAARIQRHGSEHYGLLSQSILVDPAWHGRTIRVRAYLKAQGLETEGPGGGALIIRADRRGGGYVDHNFMDSSRLTGTVDWRLVQVDLKLTADAETLRVGAMLRGKGTMWVDDFYAEVF